MFSLRIDLMMPHVGTFGHVCHGVYLMGVHVGVSFVPSRLVSIDVLTLAMSHHSPIGRRIVLNSPWCFNLPVAIAMMMTVMTLAMPFSWTFTGRINLPLPVTRIMCIDVPIGINGRFSIVLNVWVHVYLVL